jgi:hypothetical protein
LLLCRTVEFAMPESMRWNVRDSFTAAGLFLATAAFTLWQNTRVAVLWDLSYLLDSAWRFSLGQLPFRDLPFAHAPLTFLLHAALIRVLGRVYYPHIVCAAVESGLGTILTWLILRGLGSPRWLALALAVPLIVLGIYCVYPHPIYDSDAALAVLLALYLLQKAEGSRSSPLSVLAGAACVLPVFFKQNIGLAFGGAIMLYVVVAGVCAVRRKNGVASQVWTLAGMAAAGLAALALIQFTVGLPSYFYWTVTFAAQRRMPGLPALLATYRQQSLLWSIPAAVAGLILLRRSTTRWSRVVSFLLLSAPFLWTLISLTWTPDADDRADQFLSLWPHVLILGAAMAIGNLRPTVLRDQPLFPALLPLILLATIDGTFLSQQLWGSTYAIWPLFLLLVYLLLTAVPDVAKPLAWTIAGTLLVCGGLYSVSLERLSYIHLDGEMAHATLPPLLRMSTQGPWLPHFEELVSVVETEIPPEDQVLLIPGDVPFYFATGRTPRFPILLFDLAADPYTPQQTLEQARAYGIRWLIVSRNPQLKGSSLPDLDEIVRVVTTDFVLQRQTAGYDIYRRR